MIYVALLSLHIRTNVLEDSPMLAVLSAASETIFVPLTVGGGIRDFDDGRGTKWSALEVAAAYFRAGADKVSIGSEAVYAAEEYLATGIKTGKSPIEQISNVYGAQAVVISVDPRRVYLKNKDDSNHHVIRASVKGPEGEEWCWYQCTVKGGRESRDLDAYQLCTACEALGAGEILLNCVNQDGTNAGYDIAFVQDISSAVGIPVIASSGAGKVEHFYDVFSQTKCEAALAAGIFHRKEVPIESVKSYLKVNGVAARA
jgi:glutamine amidotransferase/cyclase